MSFSRIFCATVAAVLFLAAPAAANAADVTVFAAASLTNALQQVADGYKAKSGHPPVATEPQTVFGLEMVADALKRTKPVDGALDVNALARNLETAKLKTPMGEASMRAADHQVLLPLVVSVVAKDAKYKADDTALGFKPVKVFTAEEASVPAQAACKMQRPG